MNKLYIISLVICSLLLHAHRLSAHPMEGTDAKNREVLSLDKGWKFHPGDIPVPPIKGHKDTYNNAKAGRANGAAAADYDDSSWKLLNLPHDWAVENGFSPEANLSQGYRTRGIGWYRRSFRLAPADKGKHLELQLDGIATHATIWVNGTVLHRNWCGYTSMYIDITPYVTYGDNVNTIAIRVDADAQEGWWYEGAGIYRHTWLVKRSPLHIVTDGVYAHPVPKDNNNWKVPVEVSLNNCGKNSIDSHITVVLFDPAGKKIAEETTHTTIASLQNGCARLSFTVQDPSLWSPESPALYKVKTIVRQNGTVQDEVVTKCGFRTIRFDKDTGFWLNGKNIKIKGVCCHQDHAGVGVAVPDALWRFRIGKLKEMGVNAYRIAHHPAAKEFMEACDSLGLMVMDENRIFNTSPEYVRQLEWLIRRDRNCPSVIMWSVFNEEPMQGTENGYEMVRRMYRVVKNLDDTRPVTAAMNGGFFAPHNVSKAVDVAGFNYQIKNYDRFHKENPELPLISSEDGSAFMIRGEYVTDWTKNRIDSYDSQSAKWGATHRNAWMEIDTRPWMAGCFYWTGFDYRGEPTPFQWPSASSFFGIMDLCGFPKSAYFLHQAQWRADRPVLQLIPHWSWSADSIGKPIKVMTLSNMDSVKLVLNKKTISAQKVDKYDMNTWMVPYHPGKLEAIGYKGGKAVAHSVVETTGTPIRLRVTPDRNSMNGDGRDAMPLTIEALDAKGRHIPTANLLVKFKTNGPAEIIGLGNGNPNSHEPEKGNQRTLFNGLSQVIIQSKEGAGEVTFTASAEGVKAHSITIPVIQVLVPPFVPVERTSIQLKKWLVSPVSIEKPDVKQAINDNDMNSWQPTSVGELHQYEKAGFIMLHTTFNVPETMQRKGGTIQISKLRGEAEIWYNDQCIGTKTDEKEAELIVKFPNSRANGQLRFLLKAEPNQKVGLNGTVKIVE